MFETFLDKPVLCQNRGKGLIPPPTEFQTDGNPTQGL